MQCTWLKHKKNAIPSVMTIHQLVLVLSCLVAASLSSDDLECPTGVEYSSAYYSIAAPRNILPNKNYTVTVQFNMKRLFVTTVVICSDKVYRTEEALRCGRSKIFNLNIGDFKDKKCYFGIRGSGSIEFHHLATLYLPSEAYQIFIQTDKPLYKPSDTVKFRTIILNQNLRPVLNKSFQFLIKDPDGNIMKKFTEPPSDKLILSHEFGLSDQPVMGDWSIEAKVDSISYLKKFTVAEYVLPSFSIQISTPKAIDISQEKVVIPVKATYTFGKPVSGQIMVKVIEKNQSERTTPAVIVHSNFNGKKDFEFAMDDLVGHGGPKEFRVTATLTETRFGRTYNASATFFIHKDTIKVEMISKLGKYIPGIDYPLDVKVLHQDDTPVEDKKNGVHVSYSIAGSQRKAIAKHRNGVARFTLNTKLDDHQKSLQSIGNDYKLMKVYLNYKGKSYLVGLIPRADNIRCNLQAYDENLQAFYKVNQTVNIRIDFLSETSEFLYMISTKKDTKSTKVTFEPTKTYKLSLPVTSDMSPKFRVLVYTRCSTSIVVASIDVDVDHEFENRITLGSSNDIVEPGSSVNISVNTTRKATIALLGMDQQMLLLKTGNNIGENEINDFIKRSFDSDQEPSSSYIEGGNSWTYAEVWDEAGIHFFEGTKKEERDKIYYMESYSPSRNSDPNTRVSYEKVPDPNAKTRPFERPNPVPKSTKPTIALEKRDAQPIRLRKDFPETWLWETLDADESGKLHITRKAPDTITSWIVSAISLSKDKGLAISEKSKIKVFRPFFMKLNLPYSVIRAEIVSINATVYNYFDEPQEVVVTMMNDNQQLEIQEDSNDPNEIETPKSPLTKTVTAPANGGVTVSFVVKPKVLGHVDINVKAESSIAGDQILKKLLVKPEGETRYFNKAMLISGGNFKDEVNIELPADIVPDSKKVTASVVGYILGNSFNNLDNLVRMPSGCGEQIMVNFVPNILVLDYLSKINKLKPEMKAKALSHIEKGYQRELTYKHDDGSYSAFGKSDGKGSTWLTAFVLKSFLQAKKHLEIDENVLREAKRFLMQQQQTDGSFVDHGKMLSKTMQGLSTKGAAALTAYVLSAIALEPDSDKDSIVSKSQNYLTNYLANTNDAYEVSIITYALSLTKADSASTAMDKLSSLAIKKSGFTHWEQVGGSQEASIETTAYALMSYILANRTAETGSIVSYLVSQQNSNGGFISTQDTVVGLQALAVYASSLSGSLTNMNVSFTVNDQKKYDVNVDEQNKVVLQKVLLSSNTTVVNVKASGKGPVVVQVSWKYNVHTVTDSPAFDIKASNMMKKVDGSISFVITTRYLEKGESGMAIVEVPLPSGYVADEEAFVDIKKSGAKRVETKDFGTMIVVYLDQVSSAGMSFPIVANRVSYVSNLQPSLIKAYDYYDKATSATKFYSI